MKNSKNLILSILFLTSLTTNNVKSIDPKKVLLIGGTVSIIASQLMNRVSSSHEEECVGDHCPMPKPGTTRSMRSSHAEHDVHGVSASKFLLYGGLLSVLSGGIMHLLKK